MLAIITRFDLTPNPEDAEALAQAIRMARSEGFLRVTLCLDPGGEPGPLGYTLELRLYRQFKAEKLTRYFDGVEMPWPVGEFRVGQDGDTAVYLGLVPNVSPKATPEAVREAIIAWTRYVAQNEDGAEGMTIVGSEVGVEQTETGRPYRFWYDGAIRQLD